MANAASSSTSSAAGRFLRQAFKILLILPLVVVILGALILAAQSTYENIRFSNATQQIGSLVSIARDTAGRQADFAQQTGQDVLAALSHAGQITAVDDNGKMELLNPWQGALHGSVVGPSILRIDTDVPVKDCRRLALSFLDAAADLGLVGIEIASEQGGWTAFYKGGDETLPGPVAVEAACGVKPITRLGLDFRLR